MLAVNVDCFHTNQGLRGWRVTTVAQRTDTRRKRSELMAFGIVTAIASLIAVYTAVSMVEGAPRAVVLLPLAIAIGAALTAVALVSFESFLLIVLTARTALDALKVNAGTPLADPSAAVGLLLLAVVPLWLLLQHRSGALRFRLTGTGMAVGFFGVASLIGVVVSASPATSAVEWTRIAAAIAMFFAVEQLALARGEFKWRSLAAIFLAVPVPVIVAGVQTATGDGLFEAAGFERVTGSFAHSNPFAAFLVIAILMALAALAVLPDRRRVMALAVIVLGSPALLLTYTRGAWLALFIGALLVGLVLRRVSIIAGLLAVGLATALLIPSVGDRISTVTDVSGEETYAPGQDSLAWRVDYWQRALDLSEDSPVVGIGLKQVADSLPEAKQPHNDFVRAYVELGALGLIAFAVMLGRFMWIGPRGSSLLRRQRGSSVPDIDRAIAAGFAGVGLAFLVMSLTANLMSQAVVLLYVMALAGLASAVLVQASDRRSASTQQRPAETPEVAR